MVRPRTDGLAFVTYDAAKMLNIATYFAYSGLSWGLLPPVTHILDVKL